MLWTRNFLKPSGMRNLVFFADPYPMEGIRNCPLNRLLTLLSIPLGFLQFCYKTKKTILFSCTDKSLKWFDWKETQCILYICMVKKQIVEPLFHGDTAYHYDKWWIKLITLHSTSNKPTQHLARDSATYIILGVSHFFARGAVDVGCSGIASGSHLLLLDCNHNTMFSTFSSLPEIRKLHVQIRFSMSSFIAIWALVQLVR